MRSPSHPIELRFRACGPRLSGGFTLLEILLALVLLAFVMVGVWGALSGATRISHSANSLMAQGEDVQATQRFLRTWLAAAQPQPYATPGTGNRQMFHGSADAMHYVAPLPMQSGHAGLYLQTLALVQGKGDGYALKLEYIPYASGAADTGKAASHILLGDLHGGHFQYLAAAAFGKPAAWRDDWTSLSGLPLAVRIHVDPAWQARVAFPDMVIPIHAGRGCGLQARSARP
jgi:general secretion pathway protein J